ncbi:hypothetical protein B484DRAFT_20126 [Ochromonadaceae sp. CCMP2298]|nr:hypothetical protein B484DRAFT_20126 [Ochromonadaceae sp. CCMP2298]
MELWSQNIRGQHITISHQHMNTSTHISDQSCCQLSPLSASAVLSQLRYRPCHCHGCRCGCGCGCGGGGGSEAVSGGVGRGRGIGRGMDRGRCKGRGCKGRGGVWREQSRPEEGAAGAAVQQSQEGSAVQEEARIAVSPTNTVPTAPTAPIPTVPIPVPAVVPRAPNWTCGGLMMM